MVLNCVHGEYSLEEHSHAEEAGLLRRRHGYLTTRSAHRWQTDAEFGKTPVSPGTNPSTYVLLLTPSF